MLNAQRRNSALPKNIRRKIYSDMISAKVTLNRGTTKPRNKDAQLPNTQRWNGALPENIIGANIQRNDIGKGDTKPRTNRTTKQA